VPRRTHQPTDAERVEKPADADAADDEAGLEGTDGMSLPQDRGDEGLRPHGEHALHRHIMNERQGAPVGEHLAVALRNRAEGERGAKRGRARLQPQHRRAEGRGRDRRGDEHHAAPSEAGGEKARSDGARELSRQDREQEPPDGDLSPLHRHPVADDGHGERDDGPGRDPGERPHDREHDEVRREGGSDEGDREQRRADPDQPCLADHVAHGPEDRLGEGVGQGVGGGERRRGGQADAVVAGDVRDQGVDQAEPEGRGEAGDAEHDDDAPGRGGVDGGRRLEHVPAVASVAGPLRPV
jgi:hypothetical protein